MKYNTQEIINGIFLKRDRIRRSKIYEYANSRQINAVLKNDFTTYNTFYKLKIALNIYCSLSPSEYDYVMLLNFPSLWKKEGD